MARASTMPPGWLELANAYGGVGKLADHIGVSGMHLHRLAKHQTGETRKPTREAIRLAAEAKGLPNPLGAAPAPHPATPLSADLMQILELFGGSPGMEQAPPEGVARLKELVSDDQLIALSERAEEKPGSVNEAVLRAVAFLLEVD